MQTNTDKFIKHIQQVEKRLQDFVKHDAPRIIGTEAVNHFKASFDNEGFTDRFLMKWKAAKRTNSGSVWYGFRYRAQTPLPSSHPRRKGAKSKYKARKQNPITNFSPAATRKRTLSGVTGDLKESIYYRVQGSTIIVQSDQVYARIHNEGGQISVFGKRTAFVPKRQFIGHSVKLEMKLKQMLKKEVDNILK